MRLDVIVATHNRSMLLGRLLQSLLAAQRPDGLDVTIIVADNGSKDDTAELVARVARTSPIPIRYVYEARPGKSSALNTAIAATNGELVGQLDDDEEVHPSWFEVVVREFSAGDVDFVGGPYRGKWEVPAPSWLPRDYPGVIGEMETIPVRGPFGADFPGLLLGGNAVIKRDLLTGVGPYDPRLGRTGSGLGSAEDLEMYRRLLAAGGRGVFVPDLIIDHHIPAERLTKRYHRRWCYGHGKSLGAIDVTSPRPVPYVGGAPRYLWGAAARGAARRIGRALRLRSTPAEAFSDELKLWDLAGFLVGKCQRRFAMGLGTRRASPHGPA